MAKSKTKGAPSKRQAITKVETQATSNNKSSSTAGNSASAMRSSNLMVLIPPPASPINASAGTEFKFFPKLPIELRFEIYKLTWKPHIVSLKEGGGGRQAISQVSREARQEYHKHYQFLKKRAYAGRPRVGLFINYDTDVLMIPCVQAKRYGTHPYRTYPRAQDFVAAASDFQNWMEPVKRLAFELPAHIAFPPWLREQGNNIIRLPEKCEFWELLNEVFPNLEELVLVISRLSLAKNNKGPMVWVDQHGGYFGNGRIMIGDNLVQQKAKGIYTAIEVKFIAL
ncbi:hypothetical protein MBM_01813 [Drepanopeziza brunnea f. sp. 'multigermtubi' MB_m1]|uniref:2EXR domain-containing protein n=1 Tax=Marssonina brunnea f. sp. multigermtubi (strain MB_m1) TaxID=1072389 RepID=K1X3P3_MARBU|nr:uncharacterized protein MBM_01813 [Drepanopeziza brunnea f. sp. 'multigermtubi' MB_m1]EKD19861.1 hypothetical protein MBM_01813 [Drepanopeziza brunnea f. sp. 'multigermtubi' MB_m1]